MIIPLRPDKTHTCFKGKLVPVMLENREIKLNKSINRLKILLISSHVASLKLVGSTEFECTLVGAYRPI